MACRRARSCGLMGRGFAGRWRRAYRARAGSGFCAYRTRCLARYSGVAFRLRLRPSVRACWRVGRLISRRAMVVLVRRHLIRRRPRRANGAASAAARPSALVAVATALRPVSVLRRYRSAASGAEPSERPQQRTLLGYCGMSAFDGGLNRSLQHRL